MNANYDAEVDAIAIRWSGVKVDESDEIEPGVIVDYDADGTVIGVEILNASQRIQNFPKVTTVLEW